MREMIKSFLTYVKANQGSIYVVSRQKSKKGEEDRQKDPTKVCARHEFGLVKPTVKQVVNGLTANDFVRLEPDEKLNNGDLYVFRKKFRGVMLYVKLQISAATGLVICHSFHEWTNR